MATGQAEELFPIFELSYSDSTTGQVHNVGSQRGAALVRLTNGGAFHWISLRIVSSAIPLKLKYRCLYKRKGSQADMIGEALEGERCPREDALYIKKIAFLSKIYYRCWLTRYQRPDEFEQVPGGTFWSPSGQLCGTEEDNRWITSLEVKMPPLVSRTQLSR